MLGWCESKGMKSLFDYTPYVAGAYAEGDFEFTLPVSPAMLRAVKPDYRDAFALGE